MADRACHVVASATQVGLIQALGLLGGYMRDWGHASMLIGGAAFLIGVIGVIVAKAMRRDVPRYRAVLLLIMGWGFGQLSILLFGLVPYANGAAAAVSRHNSYISLAEQPTGALAATIFHALLGVFAITFSTWGSYRLWRNGTLGKA